VPDLETRAVIRERIRTLFVLELDRDEMSKLDDAFPLGRSAKLPML
jgi:hypothetical protein